MTEAGWRGAVYRDAGKKAATLLSVNHVPTFLVYHDGLLKASYLGVDGWDDLKGRLNRSAPATPATPGASHVAAAQAGSPVKCQCDGTK